jgi:maltose alpha-D-glucosyltransferase/alpha-amylase
VHGDYHLGQVLYTGHDFVIIDFEGEPTRTLYERRLKRLAMRDVAGMLRSFSYASQAALRTQQIPAERLPALHGWARFWVDCVSAAFLKSYLAVAGTESWVPQSQEDLELQLTTMLLEKALYELRYELNTRPDWVRIPLRGILDLVAPA